MMPLSFFAMLGGTCTLIGTSTNILVSSIAGTTRLRAVRDVRVLRRCGLLLLVGGGAYLLLVGRQLIPERVQAESLTEGFHLNRYLSEVVVLPGSPLIGQTLVEARLGERFDLEVLGHVRDKVMRERAGRLRHARATATSCWSRRRRPRWCSCATRRGSRSGPGAIPDDADLRSANSALIEAVITPNSELEGRTPARASISATASARPRWRSAATARTSARRSATCGCPSATSC